MTDKDFLLSSEQLKAQMRQEIDRLFDVIEPEAPGEETPHRFREISHLIEEAVASMVVGDQTIMREWLEKLREEK